MLLGALKAYAERLPEDERIPPGFERKPVRYVIDLDAAGRFLNLTDTATDTKGPAARGVPRLVPTLTRSGTRAPAALLVDTVEYALGIGRADKTVEKPADAKAEKVRWQHAAFVERVRACAEQTGEPTVRAVHGFLEGMGANAADLPLPEDLDAGALVAFRVDGALPTDLPAVRDHWALVAGEGRFGEPQECLLCGQTRPPLRVMPLSFKGVPGGQVSGSALISANANAFESYGLQQSLIAPLCQECANASHKGLDALRKGSRTHLRRDPLEYVFWTRGTSDFDFAGLMENPQPGEVRDLLSAADTARAEATGLDADRFYAASLAGSGARVAIREWLDTTVAEARDHLARFFRLQMIADPQQPREPRPFAAWYLAKATTRGGSDDKSLPPDVPRALYRVALSGGAVPLGVLFNVVRRLRAEQWDAPISVSRARAALVKLVLLSQEDSPWKETSLVTLDPEERRPAYLCGRLLSVLDEVQESALGNVNATIVDRFYGAASTTPAAVFPYLVRNGQHHLSRLRRDKRGAFVILDRTIQEILSGFRGTNRAAFPPVLSMEDQGLFVLGFYHQRAERYTRRAKASSTPSDGDASDAHDTADTDDQSQDALN